MSRFYKLTDAVDTPTTLNVARKQGGGTKYEHIKLVPGMKYELEDDPVFVNSLCSAKLQKPYSQELINKLEAFAIPYEKKYCKVCGDKMKKISFAVVEMCRE